MNEPSAAAFFGNSKSSAPAQCEPVSLNTATLAERAHNLERNTQNCAIFTPRLARKFSTRNPPSHADGVYPQNSMVEQPRNQVSVMHFDKFPDPSKFQCWKTSFKTEACSCCGYPSEAMLWIKEVVESVDDLWTSRSIGGDRSPNFEILDAKNCVRLEEDHHEPLTSRRESIWRNKRHKCLTDFSVEDKLLF